MPTIENDEQRHGGLSSDRNQVAFAGDVAVISSVDDYSGEITIHKRNRGTVTRRKQENTMHTKEDVESVRKLGERPLKTAGGKRAISEGVNVQNLNQPSTNTSVQIKDNKIS